MFSSVRHSSTKVNPQTFKVIIGDTEHTFYETYKEGAIETMVTVIVDKNVTTKYWEITKKIEPQPNMIISNDKRKLYLYKTSQENTVSGVLRENGIDEPYYVEDKLRFTRDDGAIICFCFGLVLLAFIGGYTLLYTLF